MKKIYDVNLFHDMLIESIDRIESETDFPYFFHESLEKGIQTLEQETIISHKKFDDMWIKTVESYFPSIDKITRNLKSVLRYDEELVIVEKAKKTTRRAVEHLSSNAQYIKEIKDNKVIPKKILTSQSEIEYGIYENRFIKTLINKLERFIKDRVEVIANNLKTKREIKLKYQNQFKLEGNTFNIDVSINQADHILNEESDEYNDALYQRAQRLHNLVSNMKLSQFMKLMKPYKEVTSPVTKTQIILKNSDFNNAYLLWLFLEQYHHLGFVLDTKNYAKDITPAYLKHLMQTSLIGLSSLIVHNLDEQPTADEFSRRVERSVPRVLAPSDLKTTLNDIEFTPQLINEYYLNKSKELFDSQLTHAFETHENHTVALKEVLKSTIEITNTLYATYFQINTQNKDLFNKLIRKKDLKSDYETAKERYMVSKIIREVKEQDYKDSIELEKKWQEQVLNYGQDLLEQTKKDELLYTKEFITDIKTQTNELIKEERSKIALVKKKMIATLRKEVSAQQTVSKKKIDDAIKKIKEQEKKKQLKAKEQQKLRLFKEREKLKMKHKQEQQKIKDKKLKELDKIKSKEQIRLKNIIK